MCTADRARRPAPRTLRREAGRRRQDRARGERRRLARWRGAGGGDDHDPLPKRDMSAPGAASTPVAVGEDAPIFEVMSTLRAMRRLKPDPVPDERLARLVQAAVWAPNGANRQAMEFVVVTDRALMARLAQLWGRSVEAYLNSLGRITPATQEE